MTKTIECTICGEPAVGYIQRYEGRRKAGSYPACRAHFLMAWAYQEIGQDWLRETVAGSLPIKKGKIPRFKVGFGK